MTRRRRVADERGRPSRVLAPGVAAPGVEDVGGRRLRRRPRHRRARPAVRGPPAARGGDGRAVRRQPRVAARGAPPARGAGDRQHPPRARRGTGRRPGRVDEPRPHDDAVLPARRSDVRGAARGVADARAAGRRAGRAQPRPRARSRGTLGAHLEHFDDGGDARRLPGALQRPALLGHRPRRQPGARPRRRRRSATSSAPT